MTLEAGQVLSYSAGSTQVGPSGYRVIRPVAGNFLPAISARWPGAVAALRGRTPIVLNAYPASLGRFDWGVLVDSYLSSKTAARALQLAKQHDMPVVMMSQPLIAAEMIYWHARRELPAPDAILLLVGGYYFPRSLERALTEELAARGCALSVVQGYGAAEVEAGCLLAVREAEELVYFPRAKDIVVTIDGGRLLLTLLDAAGAPIVERFDTGDRARAVDGGFVITNGEARLDPRVTRELESWGRVEWARRTGNLRAVDGRFLVQAREGVEPQGPELTFHAFAERFGGSWLDKPSWR